MEDSSFGSFVFVAYSKDARTTGLLGAIFTQIIGSVDDIDHLRSVDESESIRDPNGIILQLLRVNTLVESGGVSTHIGVGAALRDFALVLAGGLGLSHVCAVTRCTGFEAREQSSDFEDYVSIISENGAASDAGLGFHLKRGAVVLKSVSGWRPGDTANNGYGVLVLYDLAQLPPLKVSDVISCLEEVLLITDIIIFLFFLFCSRLFSAVRARHGGTQNLGNSR